MVSPNPDLSTLFIILQYYLQTKWKTTGLKGTFHKVSDLGARGRWGVTVRTKSSGARHFLCSLGKSRSRRKSWLAHWQNKDPSEIGARPRGGTVTASTGTQ